MKSTFDPPDDGFGPMAMPDPGAAVGPIVAIALLAAFTAAAGGYVAGLAIGRYGSLGSMSLWGIGALAGYLAGSFILKSPSRSAGWMLVVACFLAIVVAETCWLHWETEQGAESWWAAVTLLPVFVQEYEMDAIVAAIFTTFGALSAYRQATTCRH